MRGDPPAMEPARVADPEVLVTNFNRNFTGVSATLAAVLPLLASRYRVWLVGQPAAGIIPQGRLAALRVSRRPPAGRPFRIWHVRRNSEMIAALYARDVLRRPVRIVFTSAAIRYHSPLPRRLIAGMDAVIATSDAAASFVPHVAAVAPHGIDLARFAPPQDRAAAWQATGLPGRFGVGIVGRVRPEKGTDLFVAAMLRLLPAAPDWTAIIVGAARPADTAFQRDLQAKVAAAGLGDRIRFVGEVPAADMPAWYRRLTLVVAAARYEGYGMTVLEAMASGAAVVATRTGAFASMVAAETGALAPVGDAAALADAIAPFLADPAMAGRFGAAGARRAESFGVEREAEAIAAVYERVWAGERF